jgi:hypothetical protein
MRKPTNILFACLTGAIGNLPCPEAIENIVRENNQFDRSYGNRARKYNVQETAQELLQYFKYHVLDDSLTYEEAAQEKIELHDILDYALHGCVTLEEWQSITFDNIDWNKLAKLLITEYVD